MQKINLRELKGAPLSIILAIVMAGNRNVSVSYLVTETGYSDKTINSGLDLLRDRQIITQTGRCRYQLTGQNVQLPLYWGETTEPVNPSPASDQPALFELDGQVEKFSGKISGSGKFPELEKRVCELEKRVSELEMRKNSELVPEILPKSGENPDENGEFPHDDINNTSLSLSDISVNKNNNHDAGNFPESGKNPEISREEYIELLKDIDNDYRRFDGDERKYPEYAIVYANCEETQEFLDKLVELQPSKKAVEFFVPRTKSYKKLISWLSLSHFDAKKKLLEYYGFGGRMLVDILSNKNISLSEIDYQYQYWKLHEKDLPKWTLGTVGSRILQGFDRLSARTSEALKINCLDALEEE